MSFSTFLPTRPAKQAIFILAAACAVGWTTFAAAGGGPENVLLVVNPKSSASLTIANHFVKLRQIPDDNLLFLPWEAGRHTVNVDAFRARILLPVIKAIKEQKLAEQIDYIVYSSDFPWAVSLESDVAKFAERMRRESPPSDTKGSDDKPNDKNDKKSEATSIWPKQLTPVGSLNGLTYLWRPVLAGVPSYFEPHANLYMRPLGDEDEAPPSVGFRYETHRCFLSTMLGVTVGRGNTVEEVIDYLGRAAAADGSRPKGTIYFVQNDDIRSKVRHGLFPAAIEELKKLGVRAEIVRGKVPVNKPDVQGVVAGTASFNWKSSGSTILPGAICEHFTSFGGVMRKESSQAPLSEFLRHGAAGASGTVTEPFAIPQKFPSPMVQVHYARGCTLAEAFYQSVASPYQLLIVGDPLCRPWAEIPKVGVAGIEPGSEVSGTLRLTPAAALPEGEQVERFELYVDGRRFDACLPGGRLTFDSGNFADGWHQLRVVAVGPPPIESQGRAIMPIRLANHERTIEARLDGQGPFGFDEPIVVVVRAPGAKGIVVLHGSRAVGKLSGEEGRIEIAPGTLGAGPVRLRVVGVGGDVRSNAAAEPLEFTIKPRPAAAH